LFSEANFAGTSASQRRPGRAICCLRSWQTLSFNRLLWAGTSVASEGLQYDQHSFGGTTMDWNRVEGNWKQTKGKIKEKWGQLTEDDLTQIDGKREQLEGKIQERYGLAKDKARKDIDDWLKTMH
jgi:uncharacterized protein YjbJ (UPF0337 family)